MLSNHNLRRALSFHKTQSALFRLVSKKRRSIAPSSSLKTKCWCEWCLADQLREAGYHVVEARDADEALELLQHDGLDVKVVITDIEMPGSMNGIELAGVIRTEYP
jgi:response regulator receiver domain-containing protein